MQDVGLVGPVCGVDMSLVSHATPGDKMILMISSYCNPSGNTLGARFGKEGSDHFYLDGDVSPVSIRSLQDWILKHKPETVKVIFYHNDLVAADIYENLLTLPDYKGKITVDLMEETFPLYT